MGRRKILGQQTKAGVWHLPVRMRKPFGVVGRDSLNGVRGKGQGIDDLNPKPNLPARIWIYGGCMQILLEKVERAMTKDEYLKDHLPHRVNLLTTFRDRYSPTREMKRGKGRRKLNSEEARDLFRCSKDISMAMVRFLCDEMGLYLPEGASDPKDRKDQKKNGQWGPWAPAFPETRRFLLQEAREDPRYDNLVIVLKAANRAVVHINEIDVDHPIKVDADHEILYVVIDWVEELIESHIYQPNGESLDAAMRLPNNDMDPPPGFSALARIS